MDDNTNNILVSSVVSHTQPGTSGGTTSDSELLARNELLPETSRLVENSPGGPNNGQETATDEIMEEENEETVVPDNARLLIRSLIDHYELSREQVAAVYDEYEKMKFVSETSTIPSVTSITSHFPTSVGEEVTESNKDSAGNAQIRLQIVQEPTLARVASDSEDTVHLTDQQLQGEVNRLQSVVQNAMETYVSSPVASNASTRRALSLPDDPLPSTFARELLQRDQSLVAQAIRKYLHQYSIPQREVVEKTGINQSHLSQHFTRGVPIKPAKRIKLYHWFEQDQLSRTGKLLTADGSITSVLESPKVEGYRRRPRWRWSPVATQILTEAFKKNRFPTREQRMELSRICNEAESAMNNGEPVPGPSGDTEGITEQRINTWFTNRRKGLVSPSPTTDTFGSLSGLSNFNRLAAGINIMNLQSLSPAASIGFLVTVIKVYYIDPLTSPTSVATPDTVPTISTTDSDNRTTGGPSLTLPINLTSTGQNNLTEGISLTTPLALSPINLQALINQLQLQTNATTSILGQNLGQILVGQLPQGLLLQSPQGSINLDSLTKHVQLVGGTNGNTCTSVQEVQSNSEDATNHEEAIAGDERVNNEEEIISHITNLSSTIDTT